VKSILVKSAQFTHEKLFMSVYSSSPFLCHTFTVTFLPKRSFTYVVKLKLSPHPPIVRVVFPLMFRVAFCITGV